MYDLSRHPYFTEYKDEKSGAVSYVLTERVAEMQKHFYFAQPSVTNDGKYLWINCLNPPARYVTLAVVSLDPDNPFIRHFPYASPGAQGDHPCLDPEGNGVYFGGYDSVYKLSVDGELTEVIKLPAEFVHNRPVQRIFTHASISADNRYIAMDMLIGTVYYMAIGDVKTGEMKLLNKFGSCHNHAMFSPTNPELMLLDEDWWRDVHTGEYLPINNRIWLMNTSATRFEPLLPTEFYGRGGTEGAHDYWSGDGLICWTDYFHGAYECDVETREVTHVWKRPLCHSHSSRDRRMLVGDQSPYTWRDIPCRVLFYDRVSEQEIDIFSALPYHGYDRFYHVDPHPQFAAGDSLIVSTVTVSDGRVDVALTPVEPLLKRCREAGEVVVPHSKEGARRGSWLDDVESLKF